MNRHSVNLARQPFANARPVVRVAVLLWSLGALLTVLNLWLYGGSVSGLESFRHRRAEVEQTIGAESDRIAQAEETLRGMALAAQNEEVTFLNERIAERAFPWSQLFDQLAEVLPVGVRLQSLSPQRFLGTGRRGSREESRRIRLQMNGQARNEQDLVAFLDALFASAAFERPDLPGETVERDGSISFQLAVLFIPKGERSPSGATPDLAGQRSEAPPEVAATPPPVTSPPAAEPAPGSPEEASRDMAAAPERFTAPPVESEVGPAAAASLESQRIAAARERLRRALRAPSEPADAPPPGSTQVPVPLKPAASEPGGGR